MPHLLDLPDELLELIGDHAANTTDYFSLTLTNKRLHRILEPRLIPFNIIKSPGTGLNWAVRHNDLLLAHQFLAAKEDPNTEAPLFIAVHEGLEDMALLMLSYGVDMNTRNRADTASVLVVAIRKDRAMLRRLLSRMGAEYFMRWPQVLFSRGMGSGGGGCHLE
ncbi:hypothetical protein BJX61DRAFT_545375 [Aspergillus egyptiacus]|nr:hypothetical protein BJX61DRAFT_545375 [Aspergillus egyptiacus]